ncbi:MAG: hypothetical protein AB8I08_27695 [Sandaracinaceae bacterium]
MRIDERCGQSWETMLPEGEGRHCERCDHAVVDLSRATRAQAEALLRSRDRVCVRARVKEDGELSFQPPPPSRARRFVGGLVLAASLSACSSGPSASDAVQVVNEAPRDPEPMMPAIAAMVPTPPGSTTVPSIPTGPVPAAEVQANEAGTPSAEQRRLTTQKQARIARNQTAALPPPHHPMALGMMVGPSSF